MKITKEQLQCLYQARDILLDMRFGGSWEMHAMANAGVALLAGVISHFARQDAGDTVSEFKTPCAGISTTRTTSGGEEQGRARSFGDEGP